MKKLILLTGFILSSFAVAEEAIEIDKEDLVIAEEQGIATKAVSRSNPKVVILNNQNQRVNQEAARGQNAQAQQVSNQPVVRVMGTPISTNYASELKKSRQEAEVQTEQKIVEQLESSRLRDEQERLKKLFGEKQAPKTVVSSQSTTPTKKETITADESEIYTEVVSPVKDQDKDSIYAGIFGGQASNLTRSLENVSSYGSFGLAIGASDDSGLIMESKFMYSKHKLIDAKNEYRNNEHSYGESNEDDVYQLSGVLSLNYTPSSSSRFKPYAGAAISYNYWIYSFNNTNTENACYGVTLEYCDNQVKSDSIDLGANIGIDFMITKRISVGANMLINIVNLYNNKSDDLEYYELTNKKSVNIEETNWLIASINAKLYF